MKYVAVMGFVILSACSPKAADMAVDPASASMEGAAPAQTQLVTVTESTPSPTASEVPTVIPEKFLGVWDAAVADCKTSRDMKLTITPTAVRYWESSGDLIAVKIVSADDITVNVLMTGEGETWRETSHMALSDGGNTLIIDDGKGGVRVRCP